MARITVTLDDELAERLRAEAARRGVPMSQVARDALLRAFGRPSRARGRLPFRGLGRSGTRDTARRMEEILSREWGGALDRRS